MITNEQQKIIDIINKALENKTLKKIVFSQSVSKEIKNAVATPVIKTDHIALKLERFKTDNKAISEILDTDNSVSLLAKMATQDFAQTNVLTSGGECQIKVSKKGKILISNKIKSGVSLEYKAQNREKSYIIDAQKYKDFYIGLGVCDENGRVFDKKQSKYRQINRFVEILDDVYEKLPKDERLTVCDLCCGKSYLTFAVYFYLTHIKQRSVKMYGVDLKADCIEFCQRLAERLGFDGLEFICMDIMDFKADGKIDLVVSLHACDIATDVVLAYAAKNRARVILSTPCCHHEAAKQINCSELKFIETHSILKQKLCDAATDALRTLRLESLGYNAIAMELIDPEETPKNVLIKAIYNERMPIMKQKLAYEQYLEAVRFLGLEPTLEKLLNNQGD